MDGFAQGFGLMQNYQDSKDRKAYLQQQQAMQQRGLDMREQEFAAQQEDRQQQKDLQFAQNWWQQAAVASETQNPDMFPAWDEETQARLTRSGMLNPSHLLRPQTEAAVQYADKLAKGEGSLFSKQTVDAMNDFYAPRVNRGNGGKKRLAGMYPGQREGTFVFELEVEDEQGNKRLAPMTVNRGVAGEDDEIAQYSIEDAIKPVMGVKQLYGAFGKNMDFVRKMGRMQGWLPEEAESWERVEGPDGAILQRNTSTGEMKSVMGRKSDGAAGLMAPTSQQKNYQFLIGQLGYTPEEAYKAAFGGTSAVNGNIPEEQKLGLQLLNTQIKELDSKVDGKAGMQLEEGVLAALQQERAALVAQRAALAGQMGLLGAPGQQSAQQPQQQASQSEQGKPATVTSDEQYRALPSGTIFIDPNGKQRRKP
jgi:hypothetical protein